MERFVQHIVAGGLLLVAGLWVTAILEPGVDLWLLGPLLVIAGGASLLAGIAEPLDV